MDNSPILPDVQFQDTPIFDLYGDINPPGPGSGTLDPAGAAEDFISSVIPGGELIKNLLAAVSSVPQDIVDVMQDLRSINVPNYIRNIARHGHNAEHLFFTGQASLWGLMSNLAFGGLFVEFLGLGLGLDMSELNEEETAAIGTVDTMLGFAFALPYIITAVDSAGKVVLANRWPDSIKENLGKLAEELGLTWALGMTLEKSFEVAQGTVLEEFIKKQKRPNRIEWPQLKFMYTRKVLDKSTFEDTMAASGFRDSDIALIEKVFDQTIPIADIAQLWYRDYIDDTRAKELISILGFSDEQVEWLFDIYIAKAETQATNEYRTIAKNLFTNHLFTEGQYVAALQEGHYPSKLIEDDVKSVQLVQSIGRVLHSASDIKARRTHGSIDDAEARKELRELNYSDTYITELLQTWMLPPLHRTHGLSQSKILSYMVSGVLTAAQASPLLSATGLDAASVEFLLAHPTSNTGTRLHKLSPGLVTQAYVDGAIQDSELESSFRAANVDPSIVGKYVDVARYRASHTKGHAGYTRELEPADIRAALHNGIIDFQTCVSELQHLGYSSDSALLLTEITNKGPYVAPQPPPFASIQAAMAYLTEHGYTIINPPDPLLMAAEGMIISQGYSYQAPIHGTTNTPGSPTVGSGIPGGPLPIPGGA